MNTSKQWLVETDWLAERLDAPGVVVVDAAMNAPDKMGLHAYREEHIPGAVHFDVDDIADTVSPLPHMLPSPEKFASRMRKMGIGDGMKIVVYDHVGIFSSPRVWWMFRVMGHEDVSVLNGGLPKWKREGRPVEAGWPPQRRECHFTARKNSELVRDLYDMRRAVSAGAPTVLDARSKGRFQGREPEPHPVPRRGAMPGAKNLPFPQVLTPEGTLLPPDQLRQVFRAAGVEVTQPVITTCGSGITACILALGLATLGNTYASVYDGSWFEWSQAEDTPVVSGE